MQNVEFSIAPHLDQGEQILWSGTPRQGFLLRPIDWFVIPFSLLWGGFAVVWETTAIAGGAPIFFALWGIPFVAVGLYITGGRFLVDRRIRARTYYAVTDRRAIILSGSSTRQQVKSLNLRTLTDIALTERGSGWGTITLGPVPVWGVLPSGWPGAGQFQASQFESISDARTVYNVIRAAQRDAV